MNGMTELAGTQPVAWAVLALALAAGAGLALSSLKIKAVGLGIAGVPLATGTDRPQERQSLLS